MMRDLNTICQHVNAGPVEIKRVGNLLSSSDPSGDYSTLERSLQFLPHPNVWRSKYARHTWIWGRQAGMETLSVQAKRNEHLAEGLVIGI